MFKECCPEGAWHSDDDDDFSTQDRLRRANEELAHDIFQRDRQLASGVSPTRPNKRGEFIATPEELTTRRKALDERASSLLGDRAHVQKSIEESFVSASHAFGTGGIGSGGFTQTSAQDLGSAFEPFEPFDY
jgi:hypothetical protein